MSAVAAVKEDDKVAKPYPAPPAESREVRDSRRAYAAALADRLAEVLTEEEPDAHAAEARAIVDILAVLLTPANGGRP